MAFNIAAQQSAQYLQPATPPPTPPASGYALPFSAGAYEDRLDDIRRTEYPQLFDSSTLDSGVEPRLKTVFLDHAGSTISSASHIRAVASELLTQIPANPHSRHVESQWTQRRIDHARDRLLEFLGTTAEQYAVVFTANATAAIRLAAEITPLTSDGEFCYTRESHTSIVGVRNLVAERGVKPRPMEFDKIDAVVAPGCGRGTSLLAYTAQCNFSGQRFPLDVADRIAKLYKSDENAAVGHAPWWVLVDAAARAASSPLELNKYKAGPDFVALSMYKIFGAPTGLGALLIRRSSVPYLCPKGYFGGGTVAGLAFDRQWQVYRSDIESRLEDGTLNFQDILSLHHALDAHSRIYGSIHSVASHTQSIVRYALQAMRELRHRNGLPVCEIYGHRDNAQFGPTIAFNVKDRGARHIGYAEVDRLATMAGISLRSGRFCNPGAAQKWLQLSASELMQHSSLGFVCGDDHDLIDGKPVGALRVSFGAMSNEHDIDVLIAFLRQQFCDYSLAKDAVAELSKSPGHAAQSSSSDNSIQARVERVVIYPVKSCHGWTVPPNMSWRITRHGLRYDRSFVIMRENSTVPMQQKQYPKMALIRPRIDEQKSILVLEAQGYSPLEISLRPKDLRLEATESQICGDRIQAVRVRSDHISSWLSSVLSVSCYLACEPRLLASDTAESPDGFAGKSFANEAQILVVTHESARQVEKWVAEDSASSANTQTTRISPMQYRPNVIVRSQGVGLPAIKPFEELNWSSVSIGKSKFAVAGPCRRCQMISVDQDSAQKLKEPYATLARRMRVDGKVVFGIYLNLADKHHLTLHDIPGIRSGALIDISSG
ncbi:hypothetical protein LPJ63_000348 [Coemansia sp. RSA 2711]|nr:hypothetical protein LPJ63_000348 [Coemansia sp. RSA 2711]